MFIYTTIKLAVSKYGWRVQLKMATEIKDGGYLFADCWKIRGQLLLHFRLAEHCQYESSPVKPKTLQL
jgi:hypothetical protein